MSVSLSSLLPFFPSSPVVARWSVAGRSLVVLLVLVSWYISQFSSCITLKVLVEVTVNSLVVFSLFSAVLICLSVSPVCLESSSRPEIKLHLG